jgi:hypothetical protein
MGSGELTATMVEVHKDLIRGLGDNCRATFLDTPAGFQLNADQISQRAVDYFRRNVQRPMEVASFKSRDGTTAFDAEQAFRTLRDSGYILIGPGSPTYAVRQWRESPIAEIFEGCVRSGGCLVAASAAALTVGRLTLPVYEIYKVGSDLHWVDGIDVMGRLGFDLVVIPHWNNAEGGTHDTRFCFVGEERFRKLLDLLPEPVPILGLDEHTACILDLATGQGEVRGIGSITYRAGDREVVLASGQRFPVALLQGESSGGGDSREDWASPTRATTDDESASEAPSDTFWDTVHSLEDAFRRGIEEADARIATNAVLELDRVIWRGRSDLENEESIVEARDTLRELIVGLGSASLGAQGKPLDAVVEAFLALRSQLREEKQWALADAIRDALASAGVVVEDGREGSTWALGQQGSTGP